MDAILLEKGAKYACNFSYDSDHIWQSYLMGIKCACNDLFFSYNLKIDCVGLESHLKKLSVAGIFGPHRIDYRHIWSLL